MVLNTRICGGHLGDVVTWILNGCILSNDPQGQLDVKVYWKGSPFIFRGKRGMCSANTTTYRQKTLLIVISLVLLCYMYMNSFIRTIIEEGFMTEIGGNICM